MKIYETIQKPMISPPAWIFPVVWTVLYTLMGISAYLILTSKGEKEEIKDAIDAAMDYFKKEFDGCTLTEISYAGDETSADFAEWAQRIDGDEVIVLVSSFNVDASGGDGSLNPNSTYTKWMWIMARQEGGKWQHVDHGY